MNKVVAFLEKYAEWVALSLAALFFLYMVYDNVVSPDALRTKVGSETVLPGDVDPALNRNVITRLQQSIDAPAGDLKGAFDVKDAVTEFKTAMGPQRPRMALDAVVLERARPRLPGQQATIPGVGESGVEIAGLPVPPPAIPVGVATGDSMVAQPRPFVDDADQPVQPAPVEDPATMLANAIDKYWIMVEWKYPMADLAAAWKKAFPKPQSIPPEAMNTVFLDVVVEREELLGPGQWGNSTIVKPLPLVRREEWPKAGDAEGEERYRAWAEKNQVSIVEPPFFRILKGDPWYIPSLGQPKDPNAADVAAAADQPFDPANPPNRPLTTAEKQQVYLYKKKIRDDEEKQKAMERKQKMDAAAAASKARSGSGAGGGSGGGGRRSIGGYAPLPIQLADSASEQNRRRFTPAGAQPPAARPPVPQRSVAPDRAPSRYAPPESLPTGPMVDPSSGLVQNSLLQGPFDPTRVPVDLKGNVPDLQVWAYDDTATPGKTYRYRVKIRLKNPIFHTYGLAAKGKEALADQFAIESDWSAWREVQAPRSTEFFFATSRRPIGGKTVTQVVADIFRHEKGEWTKETFVLAPGDAVGAPKGAIDYSTGSTIVDFRLDTREKDVQVLLADESGNIETRSVDGDVNNDWYKALQEKVKAGVAPAAAGQAGTTPALINEVGSRPVRD